MCVLYLWAHWEGLEIICATNAAFIEESGGVQRKEHFELWRRRYGGEIRHAQTSKPRKKHFLKARRSQDNDKSKSQRRLVIFKGGAGRAAESWSLVIEYWCFGLLPWSEPELVFDNLRLGFNNHFSSSRILGSTNEHTLFDKNFSNVSGILNSSRTIGPAPLFSESSYSGNPLALRFGPVRENDLPNYDDPWLLLHYLK